MDTPFYSNLQSFGRRAAAFGLACVMTFSSLPLQVFTETLTSDSDVAVLSEMPQEDAESSDEAIVEQPEQNTGDGNSADVEADTMPDEFDPDEAAEDEEQNTGDGNSADVEADTAPDESDPDASAEDVAPDAREPADLTGSVDILSLSLGNWFSVGTDGEKVPAAVSGKCADFSLVVGGISAGVSLYYGAVDVIAGDYFRVRIPAALQDAYISDSFASDSVSAEISVSDAGTFLSVSFLRDGNFDASVPLRFTLSAGSTCVWILQSTDADSMYNTWTLTGPSEEAAEDAASEESADFTVETVPSAAASEEGEGSAPEEPDASAAEDDQGEVLTAADFTPVFFSGEPDTVVLPDLTDSNKISVTTRIDYNDSDWSSVTRPLEFDFPVTVTLWYEVEGESRSVTYMAQNLAGGSAFKYDVIHDGSGEGTIEVTNIPSELIVNGTTVSVASVVIGAENDASLPYYADSFSTSQVSLIPGQSAYTAGDLAIDLVTKQLTLNMMSSPADGASYTMQAVYTPISGVNTDRSSLSVNYSGSAVYIQVPAGLGYTLSAPENGDYRFSGNYSVKVGEADAQDQTAAPAGTMTADTVVSTVSYPMNVTFSFTVNWLDNNDAARPDELTVLAPKLPLYYVDDDGNPQLIDEEYARDVLGLSAVPALTVTDETLGTYAYTGLPGADVNGNPVTYCVCPQTIDGYACSASAPLNAGDTVTYAKVTDFDASIVWLDSGCPGQRPDVSTDEKKEEFLDDFVLLRTVDGGVTYEEISLDASCLTDNGNGTWSVHLSGLQKYDAYNEEYDYVLIMGEYDSVTGEITPKSIEDPDQDPSTPENYITHYNNGTTSYGNDTEKCHNGGTIMELLSAPTTFSASKVWYDDLTDSEQDERPVPTVTLWRYALTDSADTTTIDTAFQNENAARVVYHDEALDSDILLSYNLGKTDTDNIRFDSSTVTGLPADYQLSLYDEQGYKYVYFVRETLDGQDYGISYSSGTSGAGNDGEITNTRREKAAINVTKAWQCPSDLIDLEGVSVSMTVYAPNPVTGEYEPLTLLSPELNSFDALAENSASLGGFSQYISRQNLTFYANVYDANGIPYDMSRAVIKELTFVKDGVETVVTYEEDVTAGGIGTLNGHTYAAASAYTGKDENGDEIASTGYGYDLTNTITGTRDYDLTKVWQGIDPTLFQQVNFTLERKSSRDGSTYEAYTSASYPVKNSTGWTETISGTADGASVSYDVTGTAGSATDSTWSSMIASLPKYDSEGYVYVYRAREVSVVDSSGNTIPISSATVTSDDGTVYSISSHHVWTEDSTRVANYYYTPGGDNYIWVAKEWVDNGDMSQRESAQIRVYRKEDIRNAGLSADGLDAIGELNAAGVNYYSFTLSSANNWDSNDISLSGITRTILGFGSEYTPTSDDLNPDNYIVLEYTVTNAGSDVSAHFTYSCAQVLAWANTAQNSTGSDITPDAAGQGMTTQRQYKSEVGAYSDGAHFLVRNTRIGQAKLVIEKNWKDEYSQILLDSAEFVLTRSGEAIPLEELQELVAAGYITAEHCGYAFSVRTDDDGNTMTVLTLTRLADDSNHTWNLTIDQLPLFSGTAQPYYYEADEIGDLSVDDSSSASASGSASGDSDGGSGAGSGALQHIRYYVTDSGVTVQALLPTPDYLEYDYHVTNTISGTTYHSGYKYWYDAYTKGADRPDLYITLYRFLKADAQAAGITDTSVFAAFLNDDGTIKTNASGEPILTSITESAQVWEAGPGASGSGPASFGDNYVWKISVADLPWYDADGREYGYIFRESMNNGGTNVYGTYVMTQSRVSKTDENGVVYYEDVFENRLTDSMTVSGNKVWSGFLTKYRLTLPDDLPSPTVELYRTLDSSLTASYVSEHLAELQSAGTIELVNTTTLTTDKYTYNFPDVSSLSADELAQKIAAGLLVEVSDGVYRLPKYNASGAKYYYIVREALLDLNAAGNPNAITNRLYTRLSAGGTLTNTFRSDVNRRRISVEKIWAGRPSGTEDEYPTVTYTLHRYLRDDTGTMIADSDTIIDVQKITADTFEAAGGTGCTAEFTDLLIYSPNGQRYYYYVTESPINGYTTTSVVYTDSLDDSISSDPNLSDSQSDITTPGDLDRSEAQNCDEVSTTNTYDGGPLVRLSGSKIWNDYSDCYGLRPDAITVTLTRTTASEAGQHNAVASSQVSLIVTDNPDSTEAPCIVWTKSGNTWNYEIYHLPKFAANGQPYKYTITETVPDGYSVSPASVSVQLSSNDGKVDYSFRDMTNSFTTSYPVRKNWSDGDNAYNLRPSSATMVLQYSDDGGTTWQNVTYDALMTQITGLDSLPHVTHNGTEVVGIELGSANVMANTKGNSWIYTFSHLPAYRKAAGGTLVPVQYRCIETKIGAGALDSLESPDKVGAYFRSYTQQDASGTVVRNSLDDTELEIEKTWNLDNDDLYSSRPDSISFILQMNRSITDLSNPTDEQMADENWTQVTLANGEPYIITLTAADNWKKTLVNLPTAIITEDGTSYSLVYRAREIVLSDGSTLDGAQDYTDKSVYNAVQNSSWYWDSANSRNVSGITNELKFEVAKISAKKIWRNHTSDADLRAVMELVYSYDGTTWYSFGSADESTRKISEPLASAAAPADGSTGRLFMTVDQSGNVYASGIGTAIRTDGTVEWTNLPSCTTAGAALSYKIIEWPVSGYATERSSASDVTNAAGKTERSYTFTNIELQDYSVQKFWFGNESYAPKDDNGKFTAEFCLQRKVGDGSWEEVTSAGVITVSTDSNGVTTCSPEKWIDLPMYTSDGTQITYRAVETKINGKTVVTSTAGNDTSGDYIVTYSYGGDASADFAETSTSASNRLVYGYINLTKTAARLDNGSVIDADSRLQGAVFDIYTSDGKLYASAVKTDADGHLINTDGKYGTEQKYLIPGTYVLKERTDTDAAQPSAVRTDYSVWSGGIEFTVGESGVSNTGEHGTAWISTTASGSALTGSVSYLPADGTSHSVSDTCTAKTSSAEAYDLESRGVLSFHKVGSSGSEQLLSHAGSTGESTAYFGVYTDSSCTIQIAGMQAASDSASKMVLTNLAQDGTALWTDASAFDASGVPYARKDSSGVITLLSGTYYIKELTPPVGYYWSSQTVCTAVVPKISAISVSGDSLQTLYTGNIGTVHNSTDYSWTNQSITYRVYKLDQYGRTVALKSDQYLELTIVEPAGTTFLTGEMTIRLYQDAANPIRKTDGSTAVELVSVAGTDYSAYASYNASGAYWDLKSILSAGVTYELREPASAVPDNNIQAEPFRFTVANNGTVTVLSSTDTAAKVNGSYLTEGAQGGHITEAQSQMNVYPASSSDRRVVLRDNARALTTVSLEKLDVDTGAGIANISFDLQKLENTGEDFDGDGVMGEGYVSILPAGTYLVTDSSGLIDLRNGTNAAILNSVTKSALKYGLDVGSYRFVEQEAGASDTYRLVDDIYFSIEPQDPGPNPTSPDDYAKITFTTHTGVSVDSTDEKQVEVQNTPATDVPKVLALTKQGETASDKLAGARFTLAYTSVNNGQTGAQTAETVNCVTGDGTGGTTLGTLYEADSDWSVKLDSSSNPVPVDISRKGSYILKEIQAPDGYITPTTAGTTDPVTILTFAVNSANEITDVIQNTPGPIAVSPAVMDTVAGTHTLDADGTHAANPAHEDASLNVTVQDRKTTLTLKKLNDLASSVKTSSQTSSAGEALTGAKLEILQGTTLVWANYETGSFTDQTGFSVWNSDDTDVSTGTIPAGTLKELTVYTLREAAAPTGFLQADDIAFCLFGTALGGTKSQLYVWVGSGAAPATVSIDDLNGSSWSKEQNLSDNSLFMVDEAVIAPIDLRKQVGLSTDTDLSGAVFEVYDLDDNTLLGTAVSGTDGWLTWKSVESSAYAKALLYTAARKRADSADASSLIGQTLILRENTAGYQLKEISAPANAYNTGGSYTVKITPQNYTAWRDSGYSSDAYVSITAANNAAGHTVDLTTARTSGGTLVNPGYQASVMLTKYDADIEAAAAAVPGTEFTLYRKVEDAGSVNAWAITSVTNGTDTVSAQDAQLLVTLKSGSFASASPSASAPEKDGYVKIGSFLTDASGTLKLTLHLKGTYILEETAAAQGYRLPDISDRFSRTFILQDASSASGWTYGYSDTAVNDLKDPADTKGVPNTRIPGTAQLTKLDSGTGEKLDGVRFVLKRTSVPADTTLTDWLLKDSAGIQLETGRSYLASLDSLDSWIWTARDTDGNTYHYTSGSWVQDASPDAAILASVPDAETGLLKIAGLEWASYTLQETQAQTDADGNTAYILADSPHSFEVRADSRDHTIADTEAVAVRNEKNQITFKKLGYLENGIDTKALTGAVFTIHTGDAASCASCGSKPESDLVPFYASASASDSQTSITVTDASGKVTVYGLPTDADSDTATHYHLVETAAPLGYKLARPVDFTIDRHGNVQISGADQPDKTVTMIDDPIKVYIHKAGETKAALLTGAEFTLTDSCDACTNSGKLADGTTSCACITTGADGTVLIPLEKLIGGHIYCLTETKAPAGYESTAKICFSVDVNGEATIETAHTGYHDGYAALPAEIQDHDSSDSIIKDAVMISDEMIRMTVSKSDVDDSSKMLSGVEFTLTPAAGSAFASAIPAGATDNGDGTYAITDSSSGSKVLITTASGAVTKITLTTGTDGKVDIPEGLLIHGNTYELVETSLGTGNETYRFLSEESARKAVFTVETDGTPVYVSGSTAAMYSTVDTADAAKPVIPAVNQQIALEIAKVDLTTGNPLESADLKLKLSRYDASASSWLEVSEWATNSADCTSGVRLFRGTVGSVDIVPGLYMLEETETPEGYNALSSPFLFELDASGKVIKVSTTGLEADLQPVSDGSFTSTDVVNFSVSAPAAEKPVTSGGDADSTFVKVSNGKYADLKLTKKGSDNASLSGVIFRLEYLDGSGNYVYAKVDSSGNFVVSAVGSDEESKFTTDFSGTFTIHGLPNGTYRITELRTASGYSLLSSPIYIRIDRNKGIYRAAAGAPPAESDQTLPFDASDKDLLLISVVNRQGVRLPATGTVTPSLPIPVLFFTAGAEALAMWLFFRRRPRKGTARR